MIRRTWAKLRAPLDDQTKLMARLLKEQRRGNDIAEQLLKSNLVLAESLERVNAASVDTEKILGAIRHDANKTRVAAENIRAASMSGIYAEMTELMLAKQLGLIETVRKLADERMSLARYGDGELRMMSRIDYSVPFQRNSYELMASLRKVLMEPAPNTLIGMPHMYLDHHWATVFAETWASFKPSIAALDSLANSHISRPMMFGAFGQQAVEEWRRVWADRDVLVVTGEGSRFELTEALFSSARNIDTIYSTPTNAFDDIDRLLEVVAARPENLVLLSLGPAGTILANELAKTGKQALDIGHLSSSYENIINKGAFPESTPVRR